MATKICSKCNKTEIEEKYEQCYECLKKGKASSQDQVLEELKKINLNVQLLNNNLAHIRAAVCNDDKLSQALKKAKKEEL